MVGNFHRTDSRNESRTDGRGSSHVVNSSQSSGASQGESESDATSYGHTSTRSRSRTESDGESETGGGSEGKSGSHSRGRTAGGSATDSRGVANTTSEGSVFTRGDSEGLSNGVSRGTALQQGSSLGSGISVAYSANPLAIQRIIEVDTGQLKRSIPDQMAWFVNTLACLPDRFAMVKCKGMGIPFVMKIHDVVDPYALVGMGWADEEWRADDARRLIDQVRKAHGYCFSPKEVFQELPDEALYRQPRMLECAGVEDEDPMG